MTFPPQIELYCWKLYSHGNNFVETWL